MTQPIEKLPATMRAAILRGPRNLALERVPLPQLAPGEALVAVEVVGVCGSDLHLFTGERPLAGSGILGHEIVGQVVAVGAGVAPDRRGQRVVVEPNIPCGTCDRCARGLGRLCAQKASIGLTRPGGFAEYVAVPAAFAWPIPAALSSADAATIEPAAVALHALRRAALPAGAPIAVVGCGGVGLPVVAVARAQGHPVVVLDPHPGRRAAALDLGVHAARDLRDPLAAADFFATEGVVALFECAGLAATTQLCLDAAPPGSRVMLLGLATTDVALNPLRFVRAELEVRGALIYDHPTDFAATIALVASGQLAPGRGTAASQPLSALPAIFAALERHELAAKPLIAPGLPDT